MGALKLKRKIRYFLKLKGPGYETGAINIGGELGIRTLGRVTPAHDFQSCPLDQLGQLSMLSHNTLPGSELSIRLARLTRLSTPDAVIHA